MNKFLFIFIIQIATLVFNLCYSAPAVPDPIIFISPVHGLDGKIEYVNFMVQNNSNSQVSYVIGFSIENGQSTCNQVGDKGVTYLPRRNEPGATVQRSFKSEISDKSLISFYVDLKDKSSSSLCLFIGDVCSIYILNCKYM